MSGAFSVPFAALAAFSNSQYGTVIWGTMAYAAVIVSAIILWRRVVNLETRLKPKIMVRYDASIPSCDATPLFSDGTHSRCIRLRVENMGATRLYQCEGWLSIDKFPNVGPARLFWAEGNFPSAVDLTQKIPRYVQIFRITDSNQIIPATEGEMWPLDSLNKFSPGTYVFDIALKGQDDAETILRRLRLIWTGNWKTAQITDITV
jgi:hypothetical protein